MHTHMTTAPHLTPARISAPPPRARAHTHARAHMHAHARTHPPSFCQHHSRSLSRSRLNPIDPDTGVSPFPPIFPGCEARRRCRRQEGGRSLCPVGLLSRSHSFALLFLSRRSIAPAVQRALTCNQNLVTIDACANPLTHPPLCRAPDRPALAPRSGTQFRHRPGAGGERTWIPCRSDYDCVERTISSSPTAEPQPSCRPSTSFKLYVTHERPTGTQPSSNVKFRCSTAG